MAIELISKIKPKNGGKFPLVDGEDVAVVVLTNEDFDSTDQDGDLLRCSYHVGNRISLGTYEGYRINRVGIRAAAGTTVRFALYAMEQETDDSGTMTRLAILGDAVADGESQTAALTFDGGYEVRRDDTIILAFAETAALHCSTLGSGVTVSGVTQFDDADYFASESGSRIPYFNGRTAEAGTAFFSMFARDIDFFVEQRLEAYIKDTEKRLKEATESAKSALPAVSSLDDGKILCVAGGAWTAVAVADSPVAAFVDTYINEALGGDY